VFEVAEVVPVMTNNYEDSILKGVKVRKIKQYLLEGFMLVCILIISENKFTD